MTRVMQEAEKFMKSYKAKVVQYEVKLGVAEYIANQEGYTFFK